MLTCTGLLSRANQSTTQRIATPVLSNHVFQFFRIFTVVALALSIAAITAGMSIEGLQHPDIKIKVGMILYVVACALLALMLLVLVRHAGSIAESERRVLLAVGIFSWNGNATVQLVMSVLKEFGVVIVCLGVGLTLQVRGKRTQSELIRAREKRRLEASLLSLGWPPAFVRVRVNEVVVSFPRLVEGLDQSSAVQGGLASVHGKEPLQLLAAVFSALAGEALEASLNFLDGLVPCQVASDGSNHRGGGRREDGRGEDLKCRLRAHGRPAQSEGIAQPTSHAIDSRLGGPDDVGLDDLTIELRVARDEILKVGWPNSESPLISRSLQR
ncbi:hypothetical protein N7492_007307 [Penicillium capsulatum]|uniref:DUF7702 domain-containing protein n=1 Tax=Penicillium capsulatum TaxID=69766 RepID=A0A9W9LL65_9EURO|nr:hypothetical protein N7492_007307 [Penicillium capsulatum]